MGKSYTAYLHTVDDGEDLVRDEFGFHHTLHHKFANWRKSTLAANVKTKSKWLFDVMSYPEVPVFGDEHPSVPGLFARYIRARYDPETLMVVVSVRFDSPSGPPEDPTTPGEGTIEIEIDVLSTRIESSFDGQGRKIVIPAWDQPLDSPPVGPPQTRHLPEQLAKIETDLPTQMIRFRRREALSPFYYNARYAQTVNADRLGEIDPNQLLCVGFQGTIIAPNLWDVTATFHYNARRWLVDAVYIDPDTGYLANGAGSPFPGGILKDVNMFRTASFGPLGYPWN